MFKVLKNSLRTRLLISFIGIGLVPFLILLIYTLYLSETKIVNKLIIEQHEKTTAIIKRIESHLQHLHKELIFLNSLDLMDDLIADDMDKRVSRLLGKKVDDLNLDLVFMSVDTNSKIIAASDPHYLHKSLTLKRVANTENGSYIDKEYLYIYTQIRASFDPERSLGILVLKYNLNNLDQFLTHQEGVTSYLEDPSKNLHIGDQKTLHIDYEHSEKSFIDSQHLVVYERLTDLLKSWYIVYAVDKSIALEFLYDFVRFMFYVAPFIFALILYLSLKFANNIVKPIEELTSITDEITNTQNFSMRLTPKSQDEIAILTRSFNSMLATTSYALEKLEEENRLRLKRFTQLIELFNTIIQTKNREECLEVSVKELQQLTGQKQLHFQKENKQEETGASTALYITNFEEESKVYFGRIALGTTAFEDYYEQEFYSAIGVMISLQLDRIRLIKRALSASKAKSQFISSMSHELRTPLNSIIGSSQYLLVYEPLNNAQQDAVGNIESSAQYLLSMINEILDIAKIEAGKVEAHKEEVDLVVLLQNSCDMLSPLADDKDLSLHLETKDFDIDTYHTDPKMFTQIIINLLSNAIKFTSSGEIILRLHHDDKAIYITLIDSGIGITKEEISTLFHDFTQIENSLQNSLKGTGLGLSISQKIAAILGGDIRLKSEGLGKGTTAIFTLPLEEC